MRNWGDHRVLTTDEPSESMSGAGAFPKDEPQADVRTFLIADVRGYTRFTQEHGDAAAGQLATHFADLVREEVDLGRGRLLELRGDEALAVFESPRRALGTAVKLQARFAHEARDAAVPLAVGIGLDVGEAVPVEGGYRGGALNLAARLCSIAGPGEVLASRELVHLARRIPGIAYRERKPVRLKGFSSPVVAVEVVAEGELQNRPRRALPRPRLRVRHLVAVVTAIAAAAVAAVFLTRGTASALARVDFTGVGAIDPGSGRILSELFPSTSAAHLTSDGSVLWTSNPGDDTVSRIEPASSTVVHTIPVGSSPSGLATGGGDVWVADTLDGTVSRVDPAADKVVQTIRVGHDPTAVAFADGAVWVSNAGDRTLSKINPRSGRVVATVSSEAGGQVLAVDGSSLWAVDQLTDSVVEIDARAQKVLRVVHVGAGPDAIATGSGSIWIANAFDGTVSRVDPQRGIVTGTIDVGGSPVGLAAAGGRIWVADEAGQRLLAVDPASDAVVRTVGVGSPPLALAAGLKRLWLSVGASPASHRGGTLRMLSPPGSLDTLDPALAYEISSVNLLTNTNDGLVTFKRSGGSDGAQIVPDLAVSIPTPTDEGKTYTFEVRRGIRYSDGDAVAPNDFRFALERDFKLHSQGIRFYSGLVGATACVRRPATCSLARGVVVDSASSTVTFHLTAPDADFIAKLALSFADALPARTTPLRPASRPLAATGPYKVGRYVEHRLVVLVRNRAFHVWSQAAQPDGYPDRIVWDPSVGLGAATTAIEHGRADGMLALGPPPDRLSEVTTRFASQLHSHPAAGAFYLFLNARVAPFSDVRVRRALNYALDRNVFVRLEGGPQVAEATCQVLPPLIPGFRQYCRYPHSLTRARALVAQSGTKRMHVSVWSLPIDPYRSEMAYTVRVLRSLGYRASLHVPPPNDYFADIADSRSRAQAGEWFFLADYPAPSDFLQQLGCAAFKPASPSNPDLSATCDRTLDRLIAAASSAQQSDPAAAATKWSLVDRRAVDIAAVAPLLVPRSLDLLSRRAGNYQFSPEWGVLIDHLWVR